MHATARDSGKPIKATRVSNGSVDGVLRLFGYEDVCSEGAQTIRPKLSLYLREPISVTSADGDDSALIEKETGRGQPDARRSPAHQEALSREAKIHINIFPHGPVRHLLSVPPGHRLHR